MIGYLSEQLGGTFTATGYSEYSSDIFTVYTDLQDNVVGVVHTLTGATAASIAGIKRLLTTRIPFLSPTAKRLEALGFSKSGYAYAKARVVINRVPAGYFISAVDTDIESGVYTTIAQAKLSFEHQITEAYLVV